MRGARLIKPTSVRFTPDELVEVQRAAAAVGESVSKFVRRAAMGATEPVVVPSKTLWSGYPLTPVTTNWPIEQSFTA